jgi:hypothetical protein
VWLCTCGDMVLVAVMAFWWWCGDVAGGGVVL